MLTAALALVYSTSEYCAPAWSRSAHTHLIDKPINEALRIVTGCLRPTPVDNLPILAGIQPAGLRRKGATAVSAACECGAEEQTADHVILECPMYRAPNGSHGLLSVDDDTVTWLLEVCPDI